jgi:hypothetical protein
MQAGCRSPFSALDFGVRVALGYAALGSLASIAGRAASDKERQMTLTLRPQDGAC